MGSFVISWLQEDVSCGQGDDLLPGWASWKEEEEEEGCQRGEGPGYTRPCRRPGQSPCLEGELGEPGASSCSSYSPSTSPLWGRAHGREGRRGAREERGRVTLVPAGGQGSLPVWRGS